MPLQDAEAATVPDASVEPDGADTADEPDGADAADAPFGALMDEGF